MLYTFSPKSSRLDAYEVVNPVSPSSKSPLETRFGGGGTTAVAATEYWRSPSVLFPKVRGLPMFTTVMSWLELLFRAVYWPVGKPVGPLKLITPPYCRQGIRSRLCSILPPEKVVPIGDCRVTFLGIKRKIGVQAQPNATGSNRAGPPDGPESVCVPRSCAQAEAE